MVFYLILSILFNTTIKLQFPGGKVSFLNLVRGSYK